MGQVKTKWPWIKYWRLKRLKDGHYRPLSPQMTVQINSRPWLPGPKMVKAVYLGSDPYPPIYLKAASYKNYCLSLLVIISFFVNLIARQIKEWKIWTALKSWHSKNSFDIQTLQEIKREFILLGKFITTIIQSLRFPNTFQFDTILIDLDF